MEIKEYCLKLIGINGRNKTEMKAIEELSELIRAITRQDKKNITEELADCYIMMEQIKELYTIHDDEVNKTITEKTERQLTRLRVK